MKNHQFDFILFLKIQTLILTLHQNLLIIILNFNEFHFHKPIGFGSEPNFWIFL
jgi:hypothetical protein